MQQNKPTFPTPRHSEMMIKICGMREPDNIAEVASLAPMLMGFIFYPKSPRNACELDSKTVMSLPGFIRPVAVFVNDDYDHIIDICNRYRFKIVQLHGDESPELCRRLRDSGLTVFKAVSVGSEIDWTSLQQYDGSVDMFLFDNVTPSSHGGTGRKFDWQLLDDYPLSIPYMLSGGIGPDDVDSIVNAMRPGMAGIDINSRFESRPGHKDLHKLINFILSLRKFNENEPTATPFWEKTK